MSTGLRYYMHDGTGAFRFELAQAWRTASATIGDRSLILDLSFVTGMDAARRRLVSDWHSGGAKLVATTARAKSMIESITGLAAPVLATAEHATWAPFRRAAVGLIALSCILFPARANAASLKAETTSAWDEYVTDADARWQKRLQPGGHFLWAEEDPARLEKVRKGEIVVAPMGLHVPKKVPSGLIHDWIGAEFIEGATVDQVLPIVRDYDHYRKYYTPVVIGSRATSVSESEDRYNLHLMNKSVVAKTALDGDYQSIYHRISHDRWYSVTRSTRIQEIAGYGTDRERKMPEDEGKGLIWRVYSVARFEQRDGGVYVEVEGMVLSRDIPVSLRLLVDPIVRRVSRSSLVTSLEQTASAVRSSEAFASRTGAGHKSEARSVH